MMTFPRCVVVAAAGLAGWSLAGCGGTSQEYKPAAQVSTPPEEAHHGHEHARGPHGGSLIELGEDEFHAELVVDGKSHALRIYLLGPDGTSPAGVAAEAVAIALSESQSLTLQPQEGTPDAYQVVDEKAVHEIVEDGFLHATLTVKLGEKTYSAELDIHFDEDDHAGHDHGEKGHAPAAQPADSAAADQDKP
jgi:hypothetical protein